MKRIYTRGTLRVLLRFALQSVMDQINKVQAQFGLGSRDPQCVCLCAIEPQGTCYTESSESEAWLPEVDPSGDSLWRLNSITRSISRWEGVAMGASGSPFFLRPWWSPADSIDRCPKAAAILKYWVRNVKKEHADFRCKSFIVELVLAYLADRGVSLKSYQPSAVALTHGSSRSRAPCVTRCH